MNRAPIRPSGEVSSTVYAGIPGKSNESGQPAPSSTTLRSGSKCRRAWINILQEIAVLVQEYLTFRVSRLLDFETPGLVGTAAEKREPKCRIQVITPRSSLEATRKSANQRSTNRGQSIWRVSTERDGWQRQCGRHRGFEETANVTPDPLKCLAGSEMLVGYSEKAVPGAGAPVVTPAAGLAGRVASDIH